MTTIPVLVFVLIIPALYWWIRVAWWLIRVAYISLLILIHLAWRGWRQRVGTPIPYSTGQLVSGAERELLKGLRRRNAN